MPFISFGTASTRLMPPRGVTPVKDRHAAPFAPGNLTDWRDDKNYIPSRSAPLNAKPLPMARQGFTIIVGCGGERRL